MGCLQRELYTSCVWSFFTIMHPFPSGIVHNSISISKYLLCGILCKKSPLVRIGQIHFSRKKRDFSCKQYFVCLILIHFTKAVANLYNGGYFLQTKQQWVLIWTKYILQSLGNKNYHIRCYFLLSLPISLKRCPDITIHSHCFSLLKWKGNEDFLCSNWNILHAYFQYFSG